MLFYSVLPQSTTVTFFKKLVHERCGVHPDEQRLIIAGLGRTLEDGRVLGDYSTLGNGAVIYLLLRLQGGGCISSSDLYTQYYDQQRQFPVDAPTHLEECSVCHKRPALEMPCDHPICPTCLMNYAWTEVVCKKKTEICCFLCSSDWSLDIIEDYGDASSEEMTFLENCLSMNSTVQKPADSECVSSNHCLRKNKSDPSVDATPKSKEDLFKRLPRQFDSLHLCSLQGRTKYYRAQSCHTLGKEEDRMSVPICILDSIHPSWIPFLKNGIAEINDACPGVYIFLATQSNSKVIVRGCAERSCYTQGNILNRTASQVVTISLCNTCIFPDWYMKRTSVHELLHALGVAHEHQAADADKFLHNKCPTKHSLYDQFVPLQDIVHITAMDPFSIMMYPEGSPKTTAHGEGDYLLRKEGSDPVWNLKKPGERNIEMSELDKICLNQIYRPCRSATYNPLRSSVTGMWYCGRRVMQNHNRPAATYTLLLPCSPVCLPSPLLIISAFFFVFLPLQHPLSFVFPAQLFHPIDLPLARSHSVTWVQPQNIRDTRDITSHYSLCQEHFYQ